MSTNSPIRSAVVTGASRGIGRAIAAALGVRRFNVVVNYLANAAAAAETAALVQQAGGRAITVQADVGRRDDRLRLFEQSVAAFGRIDLLVNNAGIPPATREDILIASEEIYDRVMDTNLKGPFFLTQLFARHMTERDENSTPFSAEPQANPPLPAPAPRGTIINLSSLSSYAATVERSQYCIAKAGLEMVTQLYAARLAREGVLVYEIRPGIIDTDMARNAKAKYDALIHEKDLLPIARWGQAEDVARAVGAIVDGCFPYSTGAVFDVDGGYHIRRL